MSIVVRLVKNGDLSDRKTIFIEVMYDAFPDIVFFLPKRENRRFARVFEIRFAGRL